MDLNEIEVAGDFPLASVQEKTKNFEFCMEHIDSYFEDTGNLRCTVGAFPEKHSPDYCWGGCPGALQEAMHIFKAYYPNVTQEMEKVHFVVGKVEGPLDVKEDEKVLFVGDCTSWEGNINGETVSIKGNYKSPTEVDEHKTKSNDMLLKNMKTMWRCFRNKNSKYVHAKGCTVSCSDLVHYMSALGNIPNVTFDPKNVIPLNVGYWKMRAHRAFNKLL